MSGSVLTFHTARCYNIKQNTITVKGASIMEMLEKSAAFGYFCEISAIPRGSGNEAAIAAYIENFAKAHGLYVMRDLSNSVLVRRPAAAGFEKLPSVLLQGHTDMVCEKTPDSNHDFLKDGIKVIVDGNVIRADRTTLGGDDGAAVAVMLALLADESFAAPTLECLFTSGEETALVGASNFDYSNISARRMINLDTEGEGEAIAGSAGGVRVRITSRPEYETAPESMHIVSFELGGLFGGHSGCEINAGRLSACAEGVRFLNSQGVRLCEISGGNMDNAIAREFSAKVAVADPEAFGRAATEFERGLLSRATEADRGLFVKTSPASSDRVMTARSSDSVLEFAAGVFHGVYSMSKDMEGLVQTSANLASFKNSGGELTITVSARSSVDAELEKLKAELAERAKAFGLSVSFEGQYPGWQFDPDSRLARVFLREYKKQTGKDGRVNAVHAGLECGIIKSAIPDMDIISIGPNMYDIHTPNERMEADSFLRFETLVRMMILDFE